MKILNLTQHEATQDQKNVGVVEPANKNEVKALLIFTHLPQKREIASCARRLADIVKKEKIDHAMIGGAPYLMPELVAALKRENITPLFAFSMRKSKDEIQPDGSVKKTAVFKHIGFVELS